MLECPACRQLGIYEHSVQLSLDELSASNDGPQAMPTAYSRCAACNAWFRRGATGELLDAPHEGPPRLDRVVWTMPPWTQPTDEASFELSWDLAVHHFEQLVQTQTHMRPLLAFLGDLRTAGFGSRLRAGQSVASLCLSRAKEHGLRPGQSHLFLTPQRDGSVAVTGILRATEVRFGPVHATLDADLAHSLHALADLPID